MLCLRDDEKRTRFDLVRQIMGKCPLGWNDEGRIIRSQTTTDKHVIQWLCDTMNACGIDGHGDAAEVARLVAKYTK